MQEVPAQPALPQLSGLTPEFHNAFSGRIGPKLEPPEKKFVMYDQDRIPSRLYDKVMHTSARKQFKFEKGLRPDGQQLSVEALKCYLDLVNKRAADQAGNGANHTSMQNGYALAIQAQFLAPGVQNAQTMHPGARTAWEASETSAGIYNSFARSRSRAPPPALFLNHMRFSNDLNQLWQSQRDLMHSEFPDQTEFMSGAIHPQQDPTPSPIPDQLEIMSGAIQQPRSQQDRMPSPFPNQMGDLGGSNEQPQLQQYPIASMTSNIVRSQDNWNQQNPSRMSSVEAFDNGDEVASVQQESMAPAIPELARPQDDVEQPQPTHPDALATTIEDPMMFFNESFNSPSQPQTMRSLATVAVNLGELDLRKLLADLDVSQLLQPRAKAATTSGETNETGSLDDLDPAQSVQPTVTNTTFPELMASLDSYLRQQSTELEATAATTLNETNGMGMSEFEQYSNLGFPDLFGSSFNATRDEGYIR